MEAKVGSGRANGVLTGRGNERKRIFTGGDDHTHFLELVQESFERYAVHLRGIVQFDFVAERTCFEATSLVLSNLRASSDLFSVQ
jgi:hypothetical protein